MLFLINFCFPLRRPAVHFQKYAACNNDTNNNKDNDDNDNNFDIYSMSAKISNSLNDL